MRSWGWRYATRAKICKPSWMTMMGMTSIRMVRSYIAEIMVAPPLLIIVLFALQVPYYIQIAG
jgi:hypothetical protein